VTFNCERWDFATGFYLNSIEGWDSKNEEMLNGFSDGNGAIAVEVNTKIKDIRDDIESAFKYFEAIEEMPSMNQLKNRYKEKVFGIKPKKPGREKEEKNSVNVLDAFNRYVNEASKINSWTQATYEKMKVLKQDLYAVDKGMTLDKLDEAKLMEYIIYLRDRKPRKFKRTILVDVPNDESLYTKGMDNSSILRQLGFLKMFLKWASSHGYNVNKAYETFKPKLPIPDNPKIFFTLDEIKKIMSLDLKDKPHLDASRDFLIFCCLTALRYSDASNLRKSDIKTGKNGHYIETVQKKTGRRVIIPLVDEAMNILKKYENIDLPHDHALPVKPNQDFNRDNKTLCEMAGINEKIYIVDYIHGHKYEGRVEKSRLIVTHTGRHTFTTLAISYAMDEDMAKDYTGHSSVTSMKPYVAFTDDAKKHAFDILNQTVNKALNNTDNKD
jgi:integrase